MTSSSAAITISAEERTFFWRRLHSLSGIIPLGAFLLFHFFENSAARHGAEAFNLAVIEIGKLPYIYVLEIATLIVPLIFHSIYGLFITSSSRPNVLSQSYIRNWLYFFQRASGVIAFAYIFYHIWTTRVWAVFIKGDNITFLDMHAMLLDPFVFIFYLLGILAVTFHFANGLWSFSITWGLVRTRSGQRLLTFATLALFLILCLWGFDIASTFRYEKGFLTRFGI